MGAFVVVCVCVRVCVRVWIDVMICGLVLARLGRRPFAAAGDDTAGAPLPVSPGVHRERQQSAGAA